MNRKAWRDVSRRIQQGGTRALNETAKATESVAKKYAPVRNIFKGGSRSFRLKTMYQINKERDARKSLGLGPDTYGISRTVVPSRGKDMRTYGDTVNMRARRSSRARLYPGGPLKPTSMMRLHSRGKYEVSSTRADYKGGVGGRLRGEIYVERAVRDGSSYMARVVSPTPYAKYQEFGTRHNAAQPFLRPALRENKSLLVSNMKNEIRNAIRGVTIEETVEL